MKHYKKPTPTASFDSQRNRRSTRPADRCTRPVSPKERAIELSGADQDEIACLQIARHFLCSFAAPHSQAWMTALTTAEEVFDYSNGPVIASLVSRVLQMVRLSRNACFTFNNPNCKTCSDILTEHERRLLEALSSLRAGRRERAEVELMMLCEGNDTARVMMWLRELALALPPKRRVQ